MGFAGHDAKRKRRGLGGARPTLATHSTRTRRPTSRKHCTPRDTDERAEAPEVPRLPAGRAGSHPSRGEKAGGPSPAQAGLAAGRAESRCER